MAERWTRDSWRGKPIVQVPEYPDNDGAGGRRAAARELSAAGFCRRGAQPEGGAGPRRPGRGFPAARRRLRRKLHRSERQQHQRQQHPRLPARVPADGGGADLCRLGAGGEGRPHRRPVRQAALLAGREEERPGAAELSRRHHQRPGVHGRRAHARSAAADRGLSAFGLDAEPHSRADPWRLRQPRPRASVDARRRSEVEPALSGIGGPDFRGAGLHAGLRARPGKASGAQDHRLLHQPRGAAARLRAGADPRGLRRIPAPGARPRRTWSGSATAPASSITPMSSSAAASSIRSASNAARRPRWTTCCA